MNRPAPGCPPVLLTMTPPSWLEHRRADDDDDEQMKYLAPAADVPGD
ncbi:hypothetical protein [Subtercola sp. YIM 133946]